MQETSQTEREPVDFRHLIHVAGGTLAGDSAFRRALAVADLAGAKLDIAVPIGEARPADTEVLGLSRQELGDLVSRHYTEKLGEELAPFREEGRSLDIRILPGRPEVAIARDVVDRDLDLVVKLSGAGDKRGGRLAGLDQKLVRSCPCPVWIERPDASEEVRRILVPVDVDPTEHGRRQLARSVMDVALSLATLFDSEVDVLHAWSPYGEVELRGGLVQMAGAQVDAYVREVRESHARRLEELVEDLEASTTVRPHLMKGLPQHVIPPFAEETGPDLIVMGTVARSGVRGFLIGNTAESVLKQVDTGLLFVKPPGFTVPFPVGE
jgi:nucleotide-binding universal stress UspA family protein